MSKAATVPPTPDAPETPAKFVPKVIRQVSTNLLKLRPGMIVYVAITGKMEVARAMKKPGKDTENKEPPTLIPVINLETGEVQSIIAGSVLKDLLNDEYPQEKYVHKGFMIEVKDQKAAQGGGGRRYNTYDVVEIEVPKGLIPIK